MSFYLIEDIEKVHPDSRFGYDGLVKGPFKTKVAALKWLREDAACVYDGVDSYEFDGSLEDRQYFGKWGLAELRAEILPFASAKVKMKLEVVDNG